MAQSSRNKSLQICTKYKTVDNTPLKCNFSLPRITKRNPQKEFESFSVKRSTHHIKSNVIELSDFCIKSCIIILLRKDSHSTKKNAIITHMLHLSSNIHSESFEFYYWFNITICEISCIYADYDYCIGILSDLVVY